MILLTVKLTRDSFGKRMSHVAVVATMMNVTVKLENSCKDFFVRNISGTFQAL